MEYDYTSFRKVLFVARAAVRRLGIPQSLLESNSRPGNFDLMEGDASNYRQDCILVLYPDGKVWAADGDYRTLPE